jgi:hypothetical protein
MKNLHNCGCSNKTAAVQRSSEGAPFALPLCLEGILFVSHRVKHLFLGFIVALVVVGFGVVEDWFGRTYYAEDALSYLDVFRAIARGDWTLALSPQWSIGYPLILSAIRWIFPSGPEGEWTAIHVVNLVIFVATYVSFLYLLKVASMYAVKVNGNESTVTKSGGWNGFVFGIGTILFLLWQLLIGNVSRVSPDPLICCVFFLVTAACLHFFMRPSVKTAVIMGLLMGFGYVLKVAFLPTSVLMLLVVFLHGWIRSSTDRLSALSKLAWAAPCLALVALPYAAALSHAVGTFTFGQSGSLNYAWFVNHVPKQCDWQGGPAPLGTPIHPTHLVLRKPPVFTFAEPFPVTYPPWYDIPYWYEGYHHFFSIRNQISAVKISLYALRQFFFWGTHWKAKAFATFLLLALALFLLKERQTWWKRLVALGPLVLLAIVPIGIYLPVHIEPRYVVGPLILLLTLPFLPLFVPTPLISARVGYVLVILIALDSAVVLVENKKDVLDRAIHGETNTNDPAWRLGLYLAQLGVHPGDKVAAVGVGPSLDATWAYVGGVHIVGEIGNDAFDPDDQEKDLQLFINNPPVQQTVFNLFQQAGAVLVVARLVHESPQGPGWTQLPDTQWWLHPLDNSKRLP